MPLPFLRKNSMLSEDEVRKKSEELKFLLKSFEEKIQILAREKLKLEGSISILKEILEEK